MHRTFVVAAVAAGFVAPFVVVGTLHAEADAAKELAALEEEFESSDQGDAGLVTKFQPRYEALSAKYAGTEESMTAKLRLLEFTNALRDSPPAMNAAAGKIVDEILAKHPHSAQLGRLTDFFGNVAKPKADEVYRALTDPQQPDAVKAAFLMWRARLDESDKKKDAADAKYAEILAKYKDVPVGLTTYGEVLEAKLHPHAEAALEIGKPAPEIVGKSAEGKPIKLSDFKGRVVLLDFFGDW